jgi:hypothetical protein
MPAGIPGMISRTMNVRTEAAVLSSTTGQTPTAYGQAVVLDQTTGLLRLPTSTDTQISGFLVRPYPTQSQAPTIIGNDPIGSSVPLAGIPQDFMTGGYMSVSLGGSGTPVRQGKLYVWVGATSGLHVQGQVEANAGAIAWTVTPKTGGNTGTGTVSAGPLEGTYVQSPGNYVVTFTSATAFTVTSPQGDSLPPGTVGTAYNNGQISFTITAGGTAFAVNDGFTLAQAPTTLFLAGSEFMGAADSNGVTEICYKIAGVN